MLKQSFVVLIAVMTSFLVGCDVIFGEVDLEDISDEDDTVEEVFNEDGSLVLSQTATKVLPDGDEGELTISYPAGWSFSAGEDDERRLYIANSNSLLEDPEGVPDIADGDLLVDVFLDVNSFETTARGYYNEDRGYRNLSTISMSLAEDLTLGDDPAVAYTAFVPELELMELNLVRYDDTVAFGFYETVFITFQAYGRPDDIEVYRPTFEAMVSSIVYTPPAED